MKNTREFTQEELLNSKGYQKNYSNFPTPKELFKPLLDNRTKNFKEFDLHTIEGSYPTINVNDDETENISFGRMHLSKKFFIDEELHYKVGVIFSFDKNKPIVKIYEGVHVNACTNMCIFGADQIHKYDISTNPEGYISDFKRCFENITKKIETAKNIIAYLKGIRLDQDTVHKMNGAILSHSFLNKDVAGTNPILNGIKLQNVKGHKYFCDQDNDTTAWNYYNSMTEYLDEKINVLDIPEKALSIFQPLKKILSDLNITPSAEIEIAEIEVLEPQLIEA